MNGDILLPEAFPRFYESACEGKMKYPTESAAESVMLLSRKGKLSRQLREMHMDLTDLRAYRCNFCDGWHLGHGL